MSTPPQAPDPTSGHRALLTTCLALSASPLLFLAGFWLVAGRVNLGVCLVAELLHVAASVFITTALRRTDDVDRWHQIARRAHGHSALLAVRVALVLFLAAGAQIELALTTLSPDPSWTLHTGLDESLPFFAMLGWSLVFALHPHSLAPTPPATQHPADKQWQWTAECSPRASSKGRDDLLKRVKQLICSSVVLSFIACLNIFFARSSYQLNEHIHTLINHTITITTFSIILIALSLILILYEDSKATKLTKLHYTLLKQDGSSLLTIAWSTTQAPYLSIDLGLIDAFAIERRYNAVLGFEHNLMIRGAPPTDPLSAPWTRVIKLPTSPADRDEVLSRLRDMAPQARELPDHDALVPELTRWLRTSQRFTLTWVPVLITSVVFGSTGAAALTHSESGWWGIWWVLLLGPAYLALRWIYNKTAPASINNKARVVRALAARYMVTLGVTSLVMTGILWACWYIAAHPPAWTIHDEPPAITTPNR